MTTVENFMITIGGVAAVLGLFLIAESAWEKHKCGFVHRGLLATGSLLTSLGAVVVVSIATRGL